MANGWPCSKGIMGGRALSEGRVQGLDRAQAPRYHPVNTPKSPGPHYGTQLLMPRTLKPLIKKRYNRKIRYNRKSRAAWLQTVKKTEAMTNPRMKKSMAHGTLHGMPQKVVIKLVKITQWAGRTIRQPKRQPAAA